MRHTIFSLILLFISTSVFAERKEILLNENWMFRFSHQVQFKSEERVNLPHTWNSRLNLLSNAVKYKPEEGREPAPYLEQWRCPFG